MEIKKFHSSEVLHVLRHNMRALPLNQHYGNENIDPVLSAQNEVIFAQGSTPEKINLYRKSLEKEVFCYNRKNLVKAIGIVIQLPDDCPPEQEEAFYRETHRFFCEKLPMGERCILLSQIHKDEIARDADGNRISHNHLHIMYSPCVPDTKHDGYQYKLCADALTRRSDLRRLHPELQAHLDKAGIKATVYHGSSDSGQRIKLSISQLKEITKLTGQSIKRTMTVSDLVNLLNTIGQQESTIKQLKNTLFQKDQQLADLLQKETELKSQTAAELDRLKQTQIKSQQALEASQKEVSDLKQELEKLQTTTKKERTFSWRSSEPERNAERTAERSFEF